MKLFLCIFFQSTHQVNMKNFVKCYKDFFGYFNALKTHCVLFVRNAFLCLRKNFITKVQLEIICLITLLKRLVEWYRPEKYRTRILFIAPKLYLSDRNVGKVITISNRVTIHDLNFLNLVPCIEVVKKTIISLFFLIFQVKSITESLLERKFLPPSVHQTRQR